MNKSISTEASTIVKGNAQGSVITAFAIICFIGAPFLWMISSLTIVVGDLILGALLFAFGMVQASVARNKKYLEIKNQKLILYPIGTEVQRYEIPLSDISYFTHKKRQSSRNTTIFTAVLKSNEEAFWINGDFKEAYSKKELPMEFLPIKEKDFPEFIKILEKEYSLNYIKPTKSSLL
jgi:hypothetical protein